MRDADGGRQEWFVVLPDHEAAAGVAGRVPGAVCQVAHSSGRPWLVGRWDPRNVRVGVAGRTRLAFIGSCSVASQEVAGLAGRLNEAGDVPRVAAGVAGSVHVVASVDGATVALGTVSGLRRVFHAEVGGVTVAADRADVLAELAGGGVDEQALALRLVTASDALPIDLDRPVWRGVTPVAEDGCLVVERDGRRRSVRWWWPPEPVLSSREGAHALRTALSDAVGARTGSGHRLSADLSGGLDSTTLCYLAARGGHPLTTFSTDTGDPADDDPEWADRAAAGLPGGVSRVVVPGSDLPPHYADLTERGPALDEPFPGVGDRPEFGLIARLLAARGAELHLTGQGGDEVLQDSPDYLADLLRTRPLLGIRRLWTHRQAGRWPWWRLRAHLLPVSDRDRLATAARALSTTLPRDAVPRDPVHLPPWVTRAAAQSVRESLLAAAAGCSARHGGDTQTRLVRGVRFSARASRLLDQFSAAVGLPLSAPYFDTAVITACLAVRPHERTDPHAYKPLLTAAMRGIVPAASLARRTKAEGSAVAYRSLRESRANLLAMCEDSRLAELGLIDPARLREQCSTSLWTSPYLPVALSDTLSCERWLRDLRPEPSTERGTAVVAAPHP
ncbi:asparagine synthase-related protein [Actinosynnema sp. CS-041913]|uniref:asparagine synthase-related protein n=1 Tax=Actinosynnema sp. CS-041913 TaxID=3239917 RepID=UPI003D9058DF